MKIIEQAIEAALAYQEAVQNAESSSPLRHVPDKAVFRAKRKLRKCLEAMPHAMLLTLCEANALTNQCSLMDKQAIIESVFKHPNIPSLLEKTRSLYQDFT